MSLLRTALICEINMMSLIISGRVKSVNPQTSVDGPRRPEPQTQSVNSCGNPVFSLSVCELSHGKVKTTEKKRIRKTEKGTKQDQAKYIPSKSGFLKVKTRRNSRDFFFSPFFGYLGLFRVSPPERRKITQMKTARFLS